MNRSRRDFIKAAGTAVTVLALPSITFADDSHKKRHVVTLSFDDGFRKSSIKTAEIYEKYELSACINVVASAHLEEFQPPDYPDVTRGDFKLWNELQERGHEIMPHSYKHANLRQLPLDEAKDLISRCFDVFADELEGFDQEQSVYNFAYNASTPELEECLSTQVRAFRTGGGAINPLPHEDQVKLTCTSFGPGNCEDAIDRHINNLLAQGSGWLIFNTHGLDGEGWGPIRSTYLDSLLERLLNIESVDILPVAPALDKYVAQE
jgi:peptidoglycan/xylan/chitin deacetylase (PgdA/CDA1 family)